MDPGSLKRIADEADERDALIAERDALQARIDRALGITRDEIYEAASSGSLDTINDEAVRALYHEALKGES